MEDGDLFYHIVEATDFAVFALDVSGTVAAWNKQDLQSWWLSWKEKQATRSSTSRSPVRYPALKGIRCRALNRSTLMR